MTRQTCHINNMINYLLVGCLFQVGENVAAASNHVLAKRQFAQDSKAGTSVGTTASAGTGASMSADLAPEGLTGAVTTTVDGLMTAFGDASGRTSQATGQFSDHVTTFLRNSASTALDLGSAYTGTAQQLIGTGTRAGMSLGKMVNRLFGGITTAVAGTGGGGGSGYGFGYGYGSNGGYGSNSGYGSNGGLSGGSNGGLNGGSNGGLNSGSNGRLNGGSNGGLNGGSNGGLNGGSNGRLNGGSNGGGGFGFGSNGGFGTSASGGGGFGMI